MTERLWKLWHCYDMNMLQASCSNQNLVAVLVVLEVSSGAYLPLHDSSSFILNPSTTVLNCDEWLVATNDQNQNHHLSFAFLLHSKKHTTSAEQLKKMCVRGRAGVCVCVTLGIGVSPELCWSQTDVSGPSHAFGVRSWSSYISNMFPFQSFNHSCIYSLERVHSNHWHCSCLLQEIQFNSLFII